ncbi:MAG TPA: phage major capsid protein [Anaerolineae bacterium]|nr:phage major capsid protein [Anaerolineae bacterium]
MPYKVEKKGDKFCVVKESSGEEIGCHNTKGAAEDQMAALYANEKSVPNFHRAVKSITDAPNLRDQSAQSCWSCQFFQRVEGDWETRRGMCQKFDFETNENWVCDAWEERPAEPLQVEVVAADGDAVIEIDAAKTLVAYGGEIKALEGGKVGGYLVRFSSAAQPDLTGDYFDASTDFGFPKGETIKSAVWFNHRLPIETKNGRQVWIKEKIGDSLLKQVDDGVLIEAVFYNHQRYEKMLGQLGWSSGTAAHLVEREAVGKAYHVKRWPLGLDASVTPEPAEPRNEVIPLKSLKSKPLTGIDDLQATAKDAASALDGATDRAAKTNISVQGANAPTEGNPMGEGTQTQTTDARYDALEKEMKAYGERVEKLLKFMEDSPALKNAGYFTQDGGKADKEVKSFGDFLLAVKRNDVKRLHEVYGSVKAQGEDSGQAGGYLVPTMYSPELLQISVQSSPLVALAYRIPVSVRSGEWPMLDYFTTPTAGVGNTAFAAGVTAAKRAEGGAFAATQAQFQMLKWQVNSVGGIVPVNKELNADSPQSIEALLKMLFGIAIGAKKEYFMLRGNGVGEPLGIINADCTVSVSAAASGTFAYTDALKMAGFLKKFTEKVRWVLHPSDLVDFGGASWTQGNQIIKLDDLGYGSPVLSEHLPQKNNAGTALLCDFGAYLLFENGDLEVAYSEHAYFTTGQVAWRFDQRIDGMPWLKNQITLADPQGTYKVSAFVKYNN